MAKKVRKKVSVVMANHEVVVIAAYLAGAEKDAADTEDIAVKANELAPGRFTWRKYKDQISIDAVRKRLWDSTKPEKGAYLIGSERGGWRLTKNGFDFARRQIAAGNVGQPARAPKSQSERAANSRELKRLLIEDAFQKFLRGDVNSITRSEAERFFRIDDYITGKARLAKIERFRILAAENTELSEAMSVIARLVQEK